MNLYADLRWPGYLERYRDNLAAFAQDVCSVSLPESIAPALSCIEQEACRAVLHNAGPQADQGLILAVVTLWHLTTRPGSVTRISSPDARACHTNQAIKQLLAHMLTGSYYWVARGIKHRSNGWIVHGRQRGWVELRKVSNQCSDESPIYGVINALWLIEGGDQMPSAYLESVRDCVMRPGVGLVLACDWYVPKFAVGMIKHEGWPLIDVARSAEPSLSDRRARYTYDVREFVELVAGKPLTPQQAAVLADLVHGAAMAQTPR